MRMITPEFLKTFLDYNPETGLLTWKVRNSKRIHIGDIAGCKSKDGRILIGIKGRLYKAHRVAWALKTGEWPNHMIDHINNNPSDNRWSNLRAATPSQNQMNIKCIKSNTSGHKGVTWSKAAQKWRASIKANGKQFHLGVFERIEDAIRAYADAAARLHGEFANH